MPDDSPKKLIFGHHPCIDGVAGMWAISQRFGPEGARFIGMNYMHNETNAQSVRKQAGKLQSTPDETLDIYFVDYLPNDVSVIQELLDNGHKITILDHHHTAEHNIAAIKEANADNKNLRTIFNHEHPGAIIAWEAMFPGTEPPALLKLVEKMDLLSLETKEQEQAAAYVDSFDLTENQAENLAMFSHLHELMKSEGIAGLAARGHEDWLHQVEHAARLLEARQDVHIGDETYPSIRIRDITNLGRVGVSHINRELISEEDPIGLMVKETKHLVNLNIRIHPDHSDSTYEIVESMKAKAAAVASPADKDKISGGGRGIKGQVGQGAIRMPHAVAEALGIVDGPGKNRSEQRQR